MPRFEFKMQLPDLEKTIVAPATPSGKGALALIRMSGKDAFNILSSFSSSEYSNPKHKQVSLVKLFDGKQLIDECIVVFYKSPASYTGEDIVEISCHGSPYIIRTILNAAIKSGAYTANPGEFTLRAFLNGKLDLAEAEAVNALISSGSEAAHHAALAQLNGNLSDKIKGFKQNTVSLLAELEARLDDSDEEISLLDLAQFKNNCKELEESIKNIADGFKTGKGIKEGIKTVITGAPNSGKSSLMNALLGFNRAIVSPMAGTTRDTLNESVEINGIQVVLTDTAGLDVKAGNIMEEEGMRRAEEAIKGADIILLLKDSSTEYTSADKTAERRVLDFALKTSKIIKVFTKSDLSPDKKFDGYNISCKNGDGIKELQNSITEDHSSAMKNESGAIITFARHYQALKDAQSEFERISALFNSAQPPFELVAEHLRAVLKCLGGISGETTPNDVLAKIFSSFCVGK